MPWPRINSTFLRSHFCFKQNLHIDVISLFLMSFFQKNYSNNIDSIDFHAIWTNHASSGMFVLQILGGDPRWWLRYSHSVYGLHETHESLNQLSYQFFRSLLNRLM